MNSSLLPAQLMANQPNMLPLPDNKPTNQVASPFKMDMFYQQTSSSGLIKCICSACQGQQFPIMVKNNDNCHLLQEEHARYF